MLRLFTNFPTKGQGEFVAWEAFAVVEWGLFVARYSLDLCSWSQRTQVRKAKKHVTTMIRSLKMFSETLFLYADDVLAYGSIVNSYFMFL